MDMDAAEKNLAEKGASQQVERSVSPHPSPLPRGEGEEKAARTFIHWERHVVKRIGLSLDVARELRGRWLVEGEDFARVSNRIVYCEEGVQKLREKARVPEETTGEKTPPGKDLEGVQAVKMVVYRTVPNPRIVLCHLAGTAVPDLSNAVRLVVKSSKNFVRGMEAEGLRMDQEDLYELVGPTPRRKGHW